MKKNIVIFLVFLFPSIVFAKHLHTEKYYQKIWCANQAGESEVVMEDNTRCDCITESHAVEVDFSAKWAESIGQALHYSKMTGKPGGILLIIERESGWKHYNKIKDLIHYFELPLTVWAIEAADN